MIIPYKEVNVYLPCVCYNLRTTSCPQKDWEEHKDDPVERAEVMKGIDGSLFNGGIDPSLRLLQVINYFIIDRVNSK